MRLGVFAADEFDVGEFPEVAVDEFGGSLSDQDGCAVLEDVGDEAALARLFSFGKLREIVDASEAKCRAGAADGAAGALRFARGADGRAQFHQALVEGGGRVGGGDELSAEVPEACLVRG